MRPLPMRSLTAPNTASSSLYMSGLWKPMITMGWAGSNRVTRRSPFCSGSTVSTGGGVGRAGRSPKYISARRFPSLGSMSPAMHTVRLLGP